MNEEIERANAVVELAGKIASGEFMHRDNPAVTADMARGIYQQVKRDCLPRATDTVFRSSQSKLWLARGYTVVSLADASQFRPACGPDKFDRDSFAVVEPALVYLPMIRAKAPGNHAFTGLIKAIWLGGRVPIVLDPLDAMEAIVKYWGWSDRGTIILGSPSTMWWPHELGARPLAKAKS